MQGEIQKNQPIRPAIFNNLHSLSTEEGDTRSPDDSSLEKTFPNLFTQPTIHFGISNESSFQPRTLRIGVVFSGGQASGGHNVITGLFDALKECHSDCSLVGFLGGPKGIVEDDSIELHESVLAPYRNQGGFDLIGSGRDKIETPEQLASSANTVKKQKLDGLVIIGGDDSNTNAALLAEYFLQHQIPCSVIGVPKTIDGDLKNDLVEQSFGFDTAAKIYSEIIGNIARDALSAGKYYFFIKLMGRSASHITLEAALQTHPNAALIGEEILEKKQTLQEIVDYLVRMIEKRAEKNKHHGVILIPEGIIEFIPEVKTLIKELNHLLAGTNSTSKEEIREQLTPESKHCFDQFPNHFQEQLLGERDPHGNVQVSKIETERLFIELVQKKLKNPISAQPYFCGYEGRCGYPSLFDANYCYALGLCSAALLQSKQTGMMAFVSHLHEHPTKWQAGGLPIVSLMHIETRKGKEKPVIAKALVDLNGSVFKEFQSKRRSWELHDEYRYPGPIQYFGPDEITHATTISLTITSQVHSFQWEKARL